MAFIQLHQTIDPLGVREHTKIQPNTVNTENIERVMPSPNGSFVAFVSGLSTEYVESKEVIDAKLGADA